MTDEPSFPPLLTGHPVDVGVSPLHRARTGARSQEFGAGDLLWSRDEENLRFCLVLEPEVNRDRCGEMLFLAMVAIGDSIGAIGPPEVAVTHEWPNTVLLNGAEVGFVDLILPALNDGDDGPPEWMILSVRLAIRDANWNADSGNTLKQTTLWDEGCGDIERTPLLESVSRQLLKQIYEWESEGFKFAHQHWQGRLDSARPINSLIKADELIGTDENGNAVINKGDTRHLLKTLEQLAHLRPHRSKCTGRRDKPQANGDGA